MPALWPYQERGVQWLLEAPRRYLGDRMSLGKAVQAAAAARVVDPQHALWITRATATENVRREWETWGPGAGRSSLTVLSYSAGVLHDGLVDGRDYDLVILDEAHACKNPKAQRTRRALKVARQCERSWLMSGSPSPNYDPAEFYAPVAALWPGFLHALGITSHHQWRDYFCRWKPTRYGPKTTGIRPENRDTLISIFKKVMLRRTVDEVFPDLPPLRVDVHLLPRDEAMERVIAGIAKKDKENRWNAMYRRVTGEYKAPRVGDLLAQELEDAEYSKIVIIAHHTSALDRLQAKLAKYGVVRLDGSTRVKDRQAVQDQFNTDPGTKVFLGQMIAAGEALNLQISSEIALVEPSHVPDENAQAIQRIRPHMQNHKVRVRMFAVANSQDQGVIENVASKLRNRRVLGL